MAKRIKIGTQLFSTKSKAKEHVQGLIACYRNEDQIKGEDAEFVRNLLDGHPEKADKIGAGIQHFFVGNAQGGTRCFYIRRKDGTNTDFSFMKCIDGCEIA